MRTDIQGTGKFWNVQAKPLDTVLSGTNPIRLVKIDVEGAELQVLKGFQKHLLSDNPVAILCEITDPSMRSLDSSAEDLLHFMDKLGYKAYLLDNLKFTPVSTEEFLVVCSKRAPNILFSRGNL